MHSSSNKNSKNATWYTLAFIFDKNAFKILVKKPLAFKTLKKSIEKTNKAAVSVTLLTPSLIKTTNVLISKTPPLTPKATPTPKPSRSRISKIQATLILTLIKANAGVV